MANDKDYLFQIFLISPSRPNRSHKIQAEYGENCRKHHGVGCNVTKTAEGLVKVDWIRSNQEATTKIRQVRAVTNC